MKICPKCSLANEERYPACVRCNTIIMEVSSTPCSDPDDPEHQQRALDTRRHKIARGQLRLAAISYAFVITSTAVLPGLVLNPWVLLLYLISSITVVIAVLRQVAGQFSAPLLQSLLSSLLLICFGPLQPFIFFMVAAHIVLPTLLWHWIDLIHGLNR